MGADSDHGLRERLGRRVRARRDALRLTQIELAKQARVGVNTVIRMEQGDIAARRTSSWAKVEKALGWPENYIENFLAGGEPTFQAEEEDLEKIYRRDPVSEDDLVGLIHNVVYEAVIAAAPDTPLSRVREIEERALEVARRAGFGPPRKRQSTHTEDNPEP